MSEPCIYDKLSESIDILRQSGYRYGMSEREIERFIKQVLETNEPRREPPQFPILRATIKVRPAKKEDLVAFSLFFIVNSVLLMLCVRKDTALSVYHPCCLCSLWWQWASCWWPCWPSHTLRAPHSWVWSTWALITGRPPSATSACCPCPSPRSTICKV